MRRDALHVTSVEVRRMHNLDFADLRIDDLSPGVNVIYGPNGVGKTTLGEALQGLIWPEAVQSQRPTIHGRFVHEGAEYLVEIESGPPRFQRDGRDAAAPPLPPAALRDRYWLPLHELLEADGSSFADTIRRAAAGGIDVEQAVNELGWRDVVRSPRGARQDVEQAERKVAEIRRAHQELHHEEAELDRLKADRARSLAAEQDVAVLEAAGRFAAARREEAAARAALGELPEAVREVRKDDAERLKKLRAAVEEAGRRRAEAERVLSQLQADRDANMAALHAGSSSPVGRLRELQASLDKVEGAARDASRAVATAEQHERAAWNVIQDGLDPDVAATIRIGGLEALDRLVEEQQQLRAEELAWEARSRILGSEDPDELQPAIARHDAAASDLRQWLRTAREDGGGSGRARAAAWIGAAVSLAAAVVAAVLWHPAGLLALAGAVILAIVALLIPRTRGVAARSVEAQFEARGFPRPETWSIESVSARLDEIEHEAGRLRLRLEHAYARQAQRPDLDAMQRRREELEQRRTELAGSLGVAPAGMGQLHVFLSALERWQRARADRLAGQAELEQRAREMQEFRDDISALIAPFGIEAIGSVADARAATDELAEAFQELGKLDIRLEEQTRAIERARADEDRAAREINDIFGRLRLDPAEASDEEVARLCDQLEEYRRRNESLTIFRDRLRAAETELKGLDGYREQLLSASEQDLRRDLDDARVLAGQREELTRRIHDVEVRVREVRRTHDLETAMARHDAAVARLEQAAEQALDAEVGCVLAEHVAAQAREEQLPAVFRIARDLFLRITGGRYRLDLDPGRAAFVAYDTVRERGFRVEQLSSANRVQLLLAVRIAFVEQQEPGSRLPVVLDETLANSDDERARAVVEAILTLCRDGRQIFYFTAQEDEVAKWKRALEGVEHRLIPLGRATPSPEAIEADALPGTSFGRAIPAPGGHDHAEYGALLGVPHWTAWRPVASLHLWYLAEEPGQLHALMTRGLEYWGQVASLEQQGALELTGLAETDFRRMAVKAAALEAWQKRWRVGRGLPVGRDALVGSGAVSDAFFQRVHELCNKAGGDGRALVERLRKQEVRGFYSSKTDELEEYLRREGYIDDQPSLPDEEIWTHVLVRVSDELTLCGLSPEDLQAFLASVREGPVAAAGTVPVD